MRFGEFLPSNSVPEKDEYWRQYSTTFDAPANFNWDKRLIYGSLFVLWNAPERRILLAVVTQSDPIELEKGSLTLSLLSSEPKPGFKDYSFTMLESPVFYEPCKAVLDAFLNLQKMNVDFPLIDSVLGKSEKKRPPYKDNVGHIKFPLHNGKKEKK